MPALRLYPVSFYSGSSDLQFNMRQSHWILLSVIYTAGARSLYDNAQCDCYVTNGSSSAYFQYYRFYDFRDVQGPSNLYDTEPANVTDSQSSGTEPTQEGLLSSSAFTRDWNIQTWGRPAGPNHPVGMQNSKQNVYIRM